MRGSSQSQSTTLQGSVIASTDDRHGRWAAEENSENMQGMIR